MMSVYSTCGKETMVPFKRLRIDLFIAENAMHLHT